VKRSTPPALEQDAPPFDATAFDATAFDATAYILPRQEAAWVERRAAAYIIRWAEPAARVDLAVSADSDAAEAQPLPATVDLAARCALVESLPRALGAARPAFRLRLDGRSLVVAERTLPLGSGVNFRDLGGYAAAGGRRTRWGRVFRAGSLADLSDDDVAYLGQLGLARSCDLRSTQEATDHPDRLPPGALGDHRPVVARVHPLRRMWAFYRKRSQVQALLADGYRVMLDQNAPLFAGLLRSAADPANLPLVVHCTAGKDRTGLAVALLLDVLGVPDEVILADYTLSNAAFDVLLGRMREQMQPLYSLGLSEAQARPFLLAEARTLESALAYLRRRHGSAETYLAKAGLDDTTLANLRATLLL
jgi:protein-tyrosine phosphatase